MEIERTSGVICTMFAYGMFRVGLSAELLVTHTNHEGESNVKEVENVVGKSS